MYFPITVYQSRQGQLEVDMDKEKHRRDNAAAAADAADSAPAGRELDSLTKDELTIRQLNHEASRVPA